MNGHRMMSGISENVSTTDDRSTLSSPSYSYLPGNIYHTDNS